MKEKETLKNWSEKIEGHIRTADQLPTSKNSTPIKTAQLLSFKSSET